MNDSVEAPKNIAFNKGDNQICVTWNSGESSTISGSQLRCFCACSECRARKVVGVSLINESSELTDVALIGRNALNVKFSDGHERGIYPWTYLFAIAQGRGKEFLAQ